MTEITRNLPETWASAANGFTHPSRTEPTAPHPEVPEIPSRNCHGRVAAPFLGGVGLQTMGAQDVLHLGSRETLEAGAGPPGESTAPMGFSAACSIRNILGRHGRRSSVRILDDQLAKTAVELVRRKHGP